MDAQIIPADTDYRMFSYDYYGTLPGVDVAFLLDSSAYHTHEDAPHRIRPGTVQVALCPRAVASSPSDEPPQWGSCHALMSHWWSCNTVPPPQPMPGVHQYNPCCSIACFCEALAHMHRLGSAPDILDKVTCCALLFSCGWHINLGCLQSCFCTKSCCRQHTVGRTLAKEQGPSAAYLLVVPVLV